MHTIPTLIIGAGVAGASLACSLAERGKGAGVAIADPAVFGKYSSSELNGGGVRCTFAEPINVKLALASMQYYLANAARFDFRQRGYLWMYDEKLWQESREFLPVVRSFGIPVEELSTQDLKDMFPLLGDVSDLAGATLTPLDGRLSPHKLRIHYLNVAQAGGVELLDGWMVEAIEPERAPYRVTLRRISPRSVKKALTDAASRSGEELIVAAQRIINAAGPWAPQVASLYGSDLPVTPMPRQVFLLRKPDVSLERLPFFIDYPQDIYFRHYERDRKPCVLVSWSDPHEPRRIDFSYHDQDYYRTHVQPPLVRRLPQLGDAELIGGWVGHYELSADKSAIVGPVPGRPGLFNLNGLSAHGVMQSRALGEAMATYIIEGRWPAGLDLEELTQFRFGPNSRVAERMYV